MRPSLVWLAAPLGALVLLLLLRRGGRLPPSFRRLAIAGMALLVAVGFSPLTVVAMAAEPATREALQKRDEWKRIELTLGEVEALSGKGQFPFDRKGKQALLDALEARRADADALASAKAIDPAEASLLKSEVDRAVLAVQKLRPTEMQGATCYRRAMPDPVQDAFERLKTQVPMLEKVAAAQVVHPEVLAKVVGKIEEDIQRVSGAKDRAEATLLGARAREALERVRKRLGGTRTGE